MYTIVNVLDEMLEFAVFHPRDIRETARYRRCRIFSVDSYRQLKRLYVRDGISVGFDVRKNEDILVTLLCKSSLDGVLFVPSILILELEIRGLLVPFNGDLLLVFFASAAAGVSFMGDLDLRLIKPGTAFLNGINDGVRLIVALVLCSNAHLF